MTRVGDGGCFNRPMLILAAIVALAVAVLVRRS